MTPEEQQIAIAEACGWQECTNTGFSIQGIMPKISPRYCNWHRPAPSPSEEDTRSWYWLPDYLNDLNAIHEAEKTLEIPEVFTYEVELSNAATRNGEYMWHATAAQRAEAFLRTLGKYKL
jgi:hypothetical protein